MPRRRKVAALVPDPVPEANPEPHLADDHWIASLRQELKETQATARAEVAAEDNPKRVEWNQRLLQDLWEVHNQFEEISVHLSIEPSQTLFATFVEFPEKWTFKDNFDFGAVKTIELRDRAPGWIGTTLRFWYYHSPEGRGHLRGIFEWCDGESYHKYSGWMRMMNQAVLYDAPENAVDLRALHQILRDVVVKWYTAHLNRTPETFVAHLKERYPKGATYGKESYRE
jgi:hypothetical protein